MPAAPVAFADAYPVHQGDTLNVAVAQGPLANDSDGDGDPITAELASWTGNANLEWNNDGSFTLTPNAGFVGDIVLTYRAYDGALYSDFTDVTVTITDTAPVAAADSFTVHEGGVLTVPAPGVLGNDSDGDGDPITAELASWTGNANLEWNNDGSFTLTPNAGFVGDIVLTYRAYDGALYSDFTDVTVSVTTLPPSDPTDGDASPNAVAENASSGTIVGIAASSTDPEGGQVTYSLSDSAGGRFTIDPYSGVVSVADGSIIDYESSGGIFAIKVTASDGYVSSGETTFVVAVTNAAPDEPTDNDPADNIVAEGAPAGTPVGIAVSSSDPAGGTVTYTLTDNAGGRFTIDANTGVVTVADTSLIDGAGSYLVKVRASDGLLDSQESSFTIAVSAVNDAPSLAASNPPPVNEDAGEVNVPGWATFNPGGGADEAAQAPTYVVANVSNPSLFAALPSVSADATLSYTLAANANGTSTFDVYVQDDGGTDNGGVDTSSTQTFTISVNAVNDAPSFTASDPPAVDETEEPTSITVPAWASFAPGGGTDEADQTATFTVSDISNPSLFAVLPQVGADGTLTYTIAANASGSSTFAVQVRDSGGTANGGQDTSGQQVFNVAVRGNPLVVTSLENTAPAYPPPPGYPAWVTLRDAITHANSRGGTSNLIRFRPGLSGVIALTAPLPEIEANIDIYGDAGSGPITVERLNDPGIPSFRIFTVQSGVQLDLSNLIVQGGKSDDGAGIWVSEGATVNLYQVVVRNNEATGDGGGIWNTGTLTVENSQIHDNKADRGGGIFNNASLYINAESSIHENLAERQGGGILNEVGGSTTITNAYVVRNRAIDPLGGTGIGGGIANFGVLVMSSATLGGNFATISGGGLFAAGSSTNTLIGVSITFNTAANPVWLDGKGGGFYLTDPGSAVFRDCTLANNASDDEPSIGGYVEDRANYSWEGDPPQDDVFLE